MAIEVTSRRTAALLLIIGLCVFPGCKRSKRVTGQTEEEPPRAPSTVHVADPNVKSQLVAGWYDVEQNSWRWTSKRFAVVLGTPRGAGSKGAELQMHLTIPDVVISKLKSIALTASVQGKVLPPETYNHPGEFLYLRDVPGNLLSTDSVRVDFVLDKSLPPGNVDRRELGIVVDRVGLEPK